MQYFIIFTLTLGFIYFIVLTIFWIGLLRLRNGEAYLAFDISNPPGIRLGNEQGDLFPKGCLPYVSVVVAARNEEDTLTVCLKSLLAQSYPHKQYEVIIVDDHSTDNTYSIARDFAIDNPILKVLKLDNAAELGKQMALDVGIQACRGEIILSTDADCVVPNTWIENIVKAYEREEGKRQGGKRARGQGSKRARGQEGKRVRIPHSEFRGGLGGLRSQDVISTSSIRRIGVIVGFSMLDEGFLKIEEYSKDSSLTQKLRSLFIKLQSLELLSLFSAFAGGLKMGVALACTGNNLAYRRQVYDELGGFVNLGFTVAEDNMFLQWVDRYSKWQIKPVCHSDVTVLTRPMKTVNHFLRQRLRWASNSTENRLPLVCFMVIAYGFYLLLPVALLLAAFGALSWTPTLMILALKLVPEFLLVLRGLKLFNRMDLLKYFPLLEPCQLVYVLICGICGLLFKVVWKGRKYSVKRET